MEEEEQEKRESGAREAEFFLQSMLSFGQRFSSSSSKGVMTACWTSLLFVEKRRRQKLRFFLHFYFAFSRPCGESTGPAESSLLLDTMSRTPEECSPTAPGAEEPPAARDGAPNVETAAAANQADADNAMQQQPEQQQQQDAEEEKEEDVLMLPAFQTGDMVVCPNPRRAGLLWPVRARFKRKRRKAIAQSIRCRCRPSLSWHHLLLSPRRFPQPHHTAPNQHHPGRHRRPQGGPRRGP